MCRDSLLETEIKTKLRQFLQEQVTSDAVNYYPGQPCTFKMLYIFFLSRKTYLSSHLQNHMSANALI